jgi:hypothetical protein
MAYSSLSREGREKIVACNDATEGQNGNLKREDLI